MWIKKFLSVNIINSGRCGYGEGGKTLIYKMWIICRVIFGTLPKGGQGDLHVVEAIRAEEIKRIV